MGLVNKDPDKLTEVTAEQVMLAKKCGYQLVHVVIDDDEGNMVAFVSAVSFIPRVGDTITIEDGKTCRVLGVTFKVGTLRDTTALAIKYLGPNVYARVIPEVEEPLDV